MAKEQSSEEHSISNISYMTQTSSLESSYKNPAVSQPKTEYVRNKELTYFFGQPMLKGTYHSLNFTQQDASKPCLFYSHPHGEIWIGDVVDWMSTISSESVDLIFADQPYNIKKAEWDTFESQQEYVNWSLSWIEQAARVLKPTGTLYICGFSEVLAELRLPASRFFTDCRWIIWHYKNKANLGNDWGRSHESILHFRKSKKYIFNTDNVAKYALRPGRYWRPGLY